MDSHWQPVRNRNDRLRLRSEVKCGHQLMYASFSWQLKLPQTDGDITTNISQRSLTSHTLSIKTTCTSKYSPHVSSKTLEEYPHLQWWQALAMDTTTAEHGEQASQIAVANGNSCIAIEATNIALNHSAKESSIYQTRR